MRRLTWGRGAARTISQMPDVNSVQWITRPLGVPLDQASLTYGVSCEHRGRSGDPLYGVRGTLRTRLPLVQVT